MLSFSKIIAFVPTKDAKRARAFYEGLLGLRFVSEDHFALVMDAKGIMVRVALVHDCGMGSFGHKERSHESSRPGCSF